MAAQTLTGLTTNFDHSSVTGLNNGETITLNGTNLTINSDVRLAQNAAVLGQITCSSVYRNKLTITAQDTWEIPFGGGSRIYSSTVLLLGFDGAFVDESPNPKTLAVVEANGPVTLVPASSIGFGEQRASFFNGHIDIFHSGTDFDLGTGDLTFFTEFETSSSLNEKLLVGIGSTGLADYSSFRVFLTNQRVVFKVSADGVTWAFEKTSTLQFAANTPSTLKIVRSGNNWYLYINSQLSDTWVSDVSLLPNGPGFIHRIGSSSSSRYMTGYVDELILIKGVALLSGEATIVDRQNKWPRVAHTPGCSTGNVPALAALGSNTVTGLTSGATGELLRVFDKDGFLDLPVVQTAGAPMPATGFIKLRTKTGNFLPGETISLPGGATIVATDAGRRSWLNVAAREGSVTTVAKSTTAKLLGDWYLLGITDGTTNQKFQFPINDVCPGIYVETGPGTDQFEWWFSGGSRWGTTLQYIPTDTRGKYYGSDPASGTITIAKRSSAITCGYLPPAGCRVYIGNLILSNSPTTDYTANTQSGTDGSRFLVSTSANGVLEFDKVTCNWRCDFNTPYSVLIRNSSVLFALSVVNSVLRPRIENICIGLHLTWNRDTLTITDNSLGVDLINVYATRYRGEASTDRTATLTDNAGTTVIQGGVFHIFGQSSTRVRGSISNYPLAIYRSSDVTLSDVKVAGGSVFSSSVLKLRGYDLQYADLVFGETISTSAVPAYNIYNSDDVVCLGFSNYDDIANVHPYSGIMQANSKSSRVTLGEVGTIEDPYDGGTGTHVMGYLLSSSASEKILVKRSYISNHRTALLNLVSTVNYFEARDVWGRVDMTQAIPASNSVIKNCKWARSQVGQSACYGRHFEEFSTTDSNKLLNVIFNEPSQETLHLVSLYGYGQEFTYPRLSRFLQHGSGVLSDDQLTLSGTGIARANTDIAADSMNKWDWEVTIVEVVTTATVGMCRGASSVIGATNEGVAYLSNGEKMLNNTFTAYGEPYTTGDVIGVAVDMENNTVEFFKNGVSQGIAMTDMTGKYHPAVGRSIYYATYTVNFGQNPRAYPVKPGFTKDYGNPPGFFTGGGSLTLENWSDEVILEMDSFMKGVTSFNTVTEPIFTGTNSANHFVDIQYDLGLGYNGTWRRATAANFATIGAIDPEIGIKLKVRIVPSTSANNNLITYYLFLFDSTPELQAIPYPDPVVLIDGVVNGIFPGSRVKVLNKTTGIQIYNQVVTDTTLTISYEEGVDFTTGDLIEIRATSFSGATAKLPFRVSSQATTKGWSVFIEQKDDLIYEQIAIDGSTVDEFSMDTVNNYVKINRPDKATPVQRLYAWTAYHRNTEFGIAHMFDTFEAIDTLNFRRNPSEYTWYLFNELLTSVRLFGAYVYSTDDSFFIADSEAGVSGSIFMDSKRAYGVEVPTSGLTTQESALLSEVSNLAKETSVQAAIRAAKAAQAFSLL